MSVIRQYIYFDQQRIDSACAQTGLEATSKKMIIHSQERTSNLGTTLGLSLKKLFTLDFSTKTDYKDGITTETEVKTCNEEKINHLISYLHDQYYTDLDEVTHNTSTSSSTQFVYVYAPFYLPHYRNNPCDTESIIDRDVIEFAYGTPPDTVLAFGSHYELHNDYDNYMIRFSPQIILAMNVEQFAYENKQKLSSLKSLLRHSEGILHLGVLGHIMSLNNMLYYIRPLAVWI